jgi:hypothetical protein
MWMKDTSYIKSFNYKPSIYYLIHLEKIFNFTQHTQFR